MMHKVKAKAAFLCILLLGISNSWGIDTSKSTENENDVSETTETESESYLGQCSVLQSRHDRLTRIDPGKVGSVTAINLGRSNTRQRRTLARKPPLFEIPDFLTAEECDYIIRVAKDQGLSTSRLFSSYQEDVETVVQTDTDLRNLDRVSNQTYVQLRDVDAVLSDIKEKLIKVIELPRQFVEESEGLQVVRYSVGGHYHAHLDSGPEYLDSDVDRRPCCHQTTHCRSESMTQHCCQLCRYMTVLFYLNDVEEGGETAFLVADKDEKAVQDLKSKRGNFNLSYNCHNASVVVSPKKGKAVMWYNNHIDTKTGWLGDLDLFSFHGGCDVLHGEKWIANSWISASFYKFKDLPSIYSERWN